MAIRQADGSIRMKDGRIIYADTIIFAQDLQELMPMFSPPPAWPFVSGGGGGGGGGSSQIGIQGPQGAPGTQGVIGNRSYWLAKASVLDPAAYVLYKGTYDVFVPNGEFWYVLAGWNFLINNSVIGAAFQRSMNYPDLPMALSQGTRLQDDGVVDSTVYVCKPALVGSLPAYTNPQELYESRMARLQQLPVRSLTMTFAAGQSTAGGGIQDVEFPTHFASAMITQLSIEDVAWIGLFEGGAFGSLPLTFEVSDLHQVRIGEQMRFPFNRSDFPAMRSRNCCVLGEEGVNSLAGTATLFYVEIPGDW